MTDLVDPKKSIYIPATKGATITHVWGWIAAVSVLASMVACVLANRGLLPGGRLTIAVIAASWAIGAPTWFWYEYFYVYRKYANDGAWDLFKHGQQLGVAIWAGVATSLGVFAASSFSEPARTEIDCKIKAIKPTDPVHSGLPNTSSAKRAITLSVECEQ